MSSHVSVAAMQMQSMAGMITVLESLYCKSVDLWQYEQVCTGHEGCIGSYAA